MPCLRSDFQPSTGQRHPFMHAEESQVFSAAALARVLDFEGPAIVEQSDTTTVIEPDMTATVDVHGNLLVKVK